MVAFVLLVGGLILLNDANLRQNKIIQSPPIKSQVLISRETAKIIKIVDEVIRAIRPESIKDFGKVMGEVAKRTKGRAEGAKVSRLVKERMASHE